MKAIVIGGGLAGSEAALQLAKQNIEVDLYEMRPNKTTGAHKTEKFAEFVCSNSLGSIDPTNASGQLKAEMSILESYLLKEIINNQVPAGGAIAVDREGFSEKITSLIENNPKIKVIRKEITEIPTNTPTIIASGPLTSPELSEKIREFTGEQHLYFFDAIAPIIEKESINFDKAFYQNRYEKGDDDYINCPMNKEEYENFYNILSTSEKIELKEFEKEAKFFESCLPIEVIASRGIDTLRFGPLKPIGLIDKRTNEKSHAVVQLRQDDKAATLYNLVGFQTNLKWGSQKELIHSIPGLENANIVKYGVMHRNTFINSPKTIYQTLQSRKNPNIFFAGQITGTEGYTESIASGLLAGINMAKFIMGEPLLTLPSETMLGALTSYISFEGHKSFQPINSNWGIIKEMPMDRKIKKNKKLKNELLSKRASETLTTFLNSKN